jgi:hypothetical protein
MNTPPMSPKIRSSSLSNSPLYDDNQNNCGGFDDQDVNEKCREILESIRPIAEQRLNKVFSKLEAITYQTQIVAGTNHIITADTGDKVISMKIWEKLPCDGKDLEIIEISEL